MGLKLARVKAKPLTKRISDAYLGTGKLTRNCLASVWLVPTRLIVFAFLAYIPQAKSWLSVMGKFSLYLNLCARRESFANGLSEYNACMKLEGGGGV